MHTYKGLHEQAPRYISDMLTVYQLRLMGSVTLVVPMVRKSSYCERKFQCSAAKLLNVFPAHIRGSKTLNTKLLTTHLFLIHLFLIIFFLYPNLDFIHILLWNNRIIFVISYIYVLHMFMYNAFEQAFSMKRARNKNNSTIIYLLVCLWNILDWMGN